MANGAQYNAQVQDSSGKVVLGGAILFTDSAGQPLPQVGASLPSADPHVAGTLWSNAGVVTISAG